MITPPQPDASAKAPWIRTTVGLMVGSLRAMTDIDSLCPCGPPADGRDVHGSGPSVHDPLCPTRGLGTYGGDVRPVRHMRFIHEPCPALGRPAARRPHRHHPRRHLDRGHAGRIEYDRPGPQIEVFCRLSTAGAVNFSSARSTPTTLRRTPALARQEHDPKVFVAVQVSGTSCSPRATTRPSCAPVTWRSTTAPVRTPCSTPPAPSCTTSRCPATPSACRTGRYRRGRRAAHRTGQQRARGRRRALLRPAGQHRRPRPPDGRRARRRPEHRPAPRAHHDAPGRRAGRRHATAGLPRAARPGVRQDPPRGPGPVRGDHRRRTRRVRPVRPTRKLSAPASGCRTPSGACGCGSADEHCATPRPRT